MDFQLLCCKFHRYGQQLDLKEVPIRVYATAQEMKLSIKNFFSTCDQIRRKLRIRSNLLIKSLVEKFIFCAVCQIKKYYTGVTNTSSL